jgi:hypothetical protein
MNAIFGTDTLFDAEDFVTLLSRLGIDLVFTTIVITLVYYRLYRNRELVFTYYTFNIVTYAICVLLRKTPMDMGFALGLFAVFGILRYRTEEIRVRDLTYLFVVLGIAILNGISAEKVSLVELLVVNTVIAGVTLALELHARSRSHGSTAMLYDKLRLLHPEHRDALLADITARTGLPVYRVQIHRIDLLRDAAEITAFHRDAAASTTNVRDIEAPRPASDASSPQRSTVARD